MSALPELSVEEFTSKLPGRHCEFPDTEHGVTIDCTNVIGYTVTPPCDARVNREDEYTTFVCREHLGEVIAHRLAGTYPTDFRVERHDGCHHSREHDLDCDDERAR